MISPTIGRQVWYFPTMFERKLGDQPFAATVVYVHSDRNVNLVVLGHRGETIVKEHVRLVQDGESAPTEKGHCEWMPYQKGQAKAVDLAKLPPVDLTPAGGAPIALLAEQNPSYHGRFVDKTIAPRDPHFENAHRAA